MKILVTGGAGGVGQYVVRELHRHHLPQTVVDFNVPADLPAGVDYVSCDLIDREATLHTIRDCDVVVHLAAIPNAFMDPPEHVIAVNTVATFNVLEAMRENGVRRIVYLNSQCSIGFGMHDVDLKPLYVPIDEEHPLWPHEAYSFSKRYGEDMAENYARAFGVEGISLRCAPIWMAKQLESLLGLLAPSRRGEPTPEPSFGGYLGALDAAQAIRLAILYAFTGNEPIPFEVFNVAAPNTFYPDATLELLTRIYGETPDVRDPGYFHENPHASPFDTRKAQRLLGFRPRCDWRAIELWEAQP